MSQIRVADLQRNVDDAVVRNVSDMFYYIAAVETSLLRSPFALLFYFTFPTNQIHISWVILAGGSILMGATMCLVFGCVQDVSSEQYFAQNAPIICAAPL